MNNFKSVKHIVSHTTHINASPMAVFPQLCPIREYDWIFDWQCELLHSESGFNELHCVFQTHFDPIGKETWMTVRYDPDERIDFVRKNADWMVHYVIVLTPASGGTDIAWTMHIVGLTDKGNAHASWMTDSFFGGMMDRLGEALNHYLEHGTCLRVSTR